MFELRTIARAAAVMKRFLVDYHFSVKTAAASKDHETVGLL